MARLDRKTLRQIIMNELKGIVDEDALMPSPQLGEPHYLDSLESDYELDDEQAYSGGCGDPHDRNAEIDQSLTKLSDLGAGHVDVDWENPEYGHFKGDIKNLDPHSAFGTGFAMGQSGDFDDEESEQDENLPLIGYLKESCGCGCNGAPGGCDSMNKDMPPEDYEVHWDNPEYGTARVEDISNLDADTAFALGKNMGTSGDFDDPGDHKKDSYMAKPQIRKIEKYAAAIDDMVHPGSHLDDWIESKIAQISLSIGDIYHSLDYKQNKNY